MNLVTTLHRLNDPGDFLGNPAYMANRDVHHPTLLSFCVTPHRSNSPGGTGMLTCCPISYAFRPHLRTRLTLSGLTFPQETLDFLATRVLIAVYIGLLMPARVFLVCSSSSSRSTQDSRNAPLPKHYFRRNNHFAASRRMLEPVGLLVHIA